MSLIPQSPYLKSIMLANTSIPIAIGLIEETLNKNASLIELDLTNCKLGEKGSLEIAKQIMYANPTTRLSILKLNQNDVTDTAAILFAEMLQVNSSLTLLHLKYNNITAIGGDALIKSLGINVNYIINWLFIFS